MKASYNVEHKNFTFSHDPGIDFKQSCEDLAKYINNYAYEGLGMNNDSRGLVSFLNSIYPNKCVYVKFNKNPMNIDLYIQGMFDPLTIEF